MKELKLLACAIALASFALFTGCGGHDDNSGNNNQTTGTNAPASLASGSTVTLTPGDGSGAHTINIVDASNYSATFNDGSTESGTYTYTPSGDNATLVLTPTSAGATGVSTINLTFNPSRTDGNYTSDTVGSGTFAVSGGTTTTTP